MVVSHTSRMAASAVQTPTFRARMALRRMAKMAMPRVLR